MLIQSKPCKRCGKTTYSNERHWCPKLIPWLLAGFILVGLTVCFMASMTFLGDALSGIESPPDDSGIEPAYVPTDNAAPTEQVKPDHVTWSVSYVGAYTVLQDDLTKQGNMFGDTYRSKGLFHVIQVTAHNGSSSPVDCTSFYAALFDTEGRRYAPARTPWTGLSINGVSFADSPELLQPGETTTFLVGFDAPSATAMPRSVSISTDEYNGEFILR